MFIGFATATVTAALIFVSPERSPGKVNPTSCGTYISTWLAVLLAVYAGTVASQIKLLVTPPSVV
jgi:hypothetical protein